MLEPAEAFERILASGPFDDPTVASYPYRWYLASDGVLCRAAWRCLPQRYPRFKFAGVVIFGAPVVKA